MKDMIGVDGMMTDRHSDSEDRHGFRNRVRPVELFVAEYPDGHRKCARPTFAPAPSPLGQSCEYLRSSADGHVLGCLPAPSSLLLRRCQRALQAEPQLTDATSDIENSRSRSIKHQIGDHRIVLSNIRSRAYHSFLRYSIVQAECQHSTCPPYPAHYSHTVLQ
jgi:hypothetical protein